MFWSEKLTNISSAGRHKPRTFHGMAWKYSPTVMLVWFFETNHRLTLLSISGFRADLVQLHALARGTYSLVTSTN